MKNILVISSSPRRNGNSDLLCDEFIKGALEAGNKVEKVFLADKKINVCLGCGACYNTSKCIQKDDMVELNDKMVEADVIVLATPVYFYSMAGQLKVFIDRCVPRYTEMAKNKWTFKELLEQIRNFTLFLQLLILMKKCLTELLRQSEVLQKIVYQMQLKRALSMVLVLGIKAK